MPLVSGREILFSESKWMELAKELSLSPRQAQVVKCLFLGHSDKQIALDLQMAVPIVRTYLSRLFSRFDVQNRTKFVLYVLRRFHHECSHL
jgi:DNA-binding NarL/FixJ family response regulator